MQAEKKLKSCQAGAASAPLPEHEVCNSSATFAGRLFEDGAAFPSKKVHVYGSPFRGEYEVVDEDDVKVKFPRFVVDGDNAAALTHKHVHFFSKRGGRWHRVKTQQVRYETYNQTSIAISENVVVVGVPDDWGTEEGCVWLWEKNASSGEWEDIAKWSGGKLFGWSVDVDAITGQIVVGEPRYKGVEDGKVHVIQREKPRGGEKASWARVQILSLPGRGKFGAAVRTMFLTIVVAEGSTVCDSVHAFELKSSEYERVGGNLLDFLPLPDENADFNTMYLRGLAMSNNSLLGTSIFIGFKRSSGSPMNETSGVLYCRIPKGGDQYVPEQVLSHKDRELNSFAVSGNYSMIVATERRVDDEDEDDEGIKDERVLIYKLRDNKWQALTEVKSDHANIERFDTNNVCMSGHEAIVASDYNAFSFDFELVAPETDSGMKFDGTLLHESISRPSLIAIDGHNAVALTSSDSTLHFFSHDKGTWREIHSVTVEKAGSYHSENLSISGTTVVLGVPEDVNQDGKRTGSIHIFERQQNGRWSQKSRFFAPRAAEGLLFGNTAAIDATAIVVGTANEGEESEDNYVCILRLAENEWREHTIIDGEKEQYSFGGAIDIRGNTVALWDRDGITVFEYQEGSDSYENIQDSILDKYLDGNPISESYGSSSGLLNLTSDEGLLVGSSSANPAILYYRKQEGDGKYILVQEFPRHEIFPDYHWHESHVSEGGGHFVVGSSSLCKETKAIHSHYLIHRLGKDFLWEEVHEMRSETDYKRMPGDGNTFVRQRCDRQSAWGMALEINNHYGTTPCLRSAVAISKDKLLISSMGQNANLFAFNVSAV